MSPETQKIEALLFLSGEAVSHAELARLAKVSVAEIPNYLDELQQALQHHGLTLTVTDNHVQLTTSPRVADYLTQFIKQESQDLSAAAAETLALIAYRGPISRPDIDAIRGVDGRRIVRQLLQRGLIRKDSRTSRADAGSTAPPRRAARYSVTEEFLQRLGIERTSDLPDFDTLSSHAKIEQLLNSQEN